jgi:hypothetical protein
VEGVNAGIGGVMGGDDQNEDMSLDLILSESDQRAASERRVRFDAPDEASSKVVVARTDQELVREDIDHPPSDDIDDPMLVDTLSLCGKRTSEVENETIKKIKNSATSLTLVTREASVAAEMKSLPYQDGPSTGLLCLDQRQELPMLAAETTLQAAQNELSVSSTSPSALTTVAAASSLDQSEDNSLEAEALGSEIRRRSERIISLKERDASLKQKDAVKKSAEKTVPSPKHTEAKSPRITKKLRTRSSRPKTRSLAQRELDSFVAWQRTQEEKEEEEDEEEKEVILDDDYNNNL